MKACLEKFADVKLSNRFKSGDRNKTRAGLAFKAFYTTVLQQAGKNIFLSSVL
jgi:hypothetical protein